MNIPPTIGMVVSHGKASLVELSTVLNLEDLHDLMEVIVVDNHNAAVLHKLEEDKIPRG